MASICSVTFIDPSSLAIPDAFRPATSNAVSTGPNSRTSVIATIWPTCPVAPYCGNGRLQEIEQSGPRISRCYHDAHLETLEPHDFRRRMILERVARVDDQL